LLVAFVADDDEAFAARLFNGVLAREEEEDGEDDAPIDTNFLREGVAALEVLPDADGTRGVEVDDFEGVRDDVAAAVDRLADEEEEEEEMLSIAFLPLATRSSDSSSSSVALVSILARGGGLRSPIAPPAINSSSRRDEERFKMRDFSSTEATPEACNKSSSRDATVVSIKDSS